MKRVLLLTLFLSSVALLVSTSVAAQKAPAAHKPAAAPAAAGWTVPANAAKEKSPLPPSETTISAGKALFAKNCTRCHGTEGHGDGPDADHHHADHMNLTRAAGAAQNPDGVVFYKVWNGRTGPKMPAFKEKLTKEQVWALVAYVQTLRAKK